MSDLARRKVFGLVSVAAVCVAAVLSAAPAIAARRAPPNDDFKDAIAIRLDQAVKGTITGASADAPHEGYGPSVWYRLRVKRDVMVDISACGKFEPSIIVYRGRSLGSLRRVRYSESVCRSGFGIAFKARRGRSYAIEVLDEFPTPAPRGTFRLRVASIPTPPNDEFVDALPLRLGTTVAGTTAGGTGEPGEPRRCCGVLHTVWYRLRVATPGHVRLSACNPRLYNDTAVAVYTGDRLNGLTRAAYYGTCFVDFAAQPGVTYRVVADDRGHWGRFRLSARATTPPPNDNFADATAITLGTTVSATTRYATPEAGEPPNGGAFTVWFRLALAENTPIELTVANNEPETPLAPANGGHLTFASSEATN